MYGTVMVPPIAQISLFASLAFLVIGSPGAYAITNTLVGGRFLNDEGNPTLVGTLAHTVVVGILMALYLSTFTMNV